MKQRHAFLNFLFLLATAWAQIASAADAPAPDQITLTGSFVWAKQAPKTNELKAKLTPDGPQKWKAVYSFNNPLGGKPTVYTGTITGDLQNGPVKGTAINAEGKRTFTLEGTAKDGVLTFDHAETTPNRVGPTGTGTLKREAKP